MCDSHIAHGNVVHLKRDKKIDKYFLFDLGVCPFIKGAR